MKIKKKTILLVSCILVFALEINALADILGEIVGGYNTGMGVKTDFYHNVYKNGETYQREYYVEYEPNSSVVPVVVNGDSIYGKRTITQAISYMQANGMKPLIGINADYFSFKTGIPMGHTIMDGELVTMDTTGQNAVGFNADGTGFISWLQIQSTFTKPDGTQMFLDCINKWCQPTISASYLLTDKFSSSTKTSGSCKFVIFSPVGGKLSIGSSVTLRVDEKFDYDGEIAIPDGKYVLVMTNTYGDTSKLAFMDSLEVGSEITLKNEAVYDKELWANAQNGMGSVGGRLIEKGTVNSNFEAGTAPRTAVGVKADGKLIFYVIDGRQAGFSTGVQIKTLAKRMAELGCVDAINLDGGGSTAIAGIFPGSDEYSVINSPSEGRLRSCANYIFLKDGRTPTGDGEFFFFDNMTENRNYLSGFVDTINVTRVVDTGGYDIDLSALTFTAENPEYTNITVNDNKAVISGSGEGYVVVHAGKGFKYLTYNIYDTPDEITAIAYNLPISELSYAVGDSFGTDIDAKAFVNTIELNSMDSCFNWSCDDGIGTIDDNGYFVPDTSSPKSGSVYIRAGEKTLEIPIVIRERDVFADMGAHWAKPYAEALYKEGIITGENAENGLVYRPDSNITRGEFAVIISRYLKLDTSAYEDFGFADSQYIPGWQRPAANAAAALGIITGKQTDTGVTFSGSDSLTRAEAIAILGRISENDAEFPDAVFSDSELVPDFAKNSVRLLVGLGIINGYEDGTLRPGGNVTRGECAKMIFKCKDVL